MRSAGEARLFCQPDEQGDGDTLSNRPLIAIDVETTGLDASSDRVLELAIVRIDRDGRIDDEWVSLFEVDCDVGPTFIHHITNEMVAGASTFGDLVGEILPRLEGGIIVSHYVEFEEGFVRRELARVGVELPPQPALCTLNLARNQLGASPNFRLTTCCEHVGLEQTDTGGALGDARCKAFLALHLLSTATFVPTWPVQPTLMPRCPSTGTPRTRVTSLRKGKAGWMASVIAKLPMSTGTAEPAVADIYVNAVALLLEDGRLTGDEARVLARMAGHAGLGWRQVDELNRRFLDGLAVAALDDHVLTASEFSQLQRSASQLGAPDHFASLVDQVEASSARPSPVATKPRVWCSPSIPASSRAALERAGVSMARNLTAKVEAAIVCSSDMRDGRVLRARSAGIVVRLPHEIPELSPRQGRNGHHLPRPRGARHRPPWLDEAASAR